MKNVKKRTVLKNYDRIVAFKGGVPEIEFTTKSDNLRKLSVYNKMHRTVSTLNTQSVSFKSFDK